MTDAEAAATVQGSPEWFAARCGYAGASSFDAIVAKGQGTMRRKYLYQLIAERLTGKVAESYSNGHMLRGIQQEPMARISYEALTGNPVKQVGFLRHSGGKLMVGASPDGLVDDDGGVEIKSVIPTVQLATIDAGGCPSEHRCQIQGSMWITGRRWWDFVSYSADLPANLRTYVFRVQRDDQYIIDLAAEVIVFLQEVDSRVVHYLTRERTA